MRVKHSAALVSETAVILDNIGIEAAQHSNVAVSHSVMSQATNDGAKADDVTGDARIRVDDSTITFNTNGISTGAGGAAFASGNTLAVNTSCEFNVAGGTSFFTFGDNRNTGGPGVCGALQPTLTKN